MNADTALRLTAKGVRSSMGQFAPDRIVAVAAQFVDDIAKELATAARLEAPSGSPDEDVTAHELIARAAEARVADLIDRRSAKELFGGEKPLNPRLVVELLVVADSRVRIYVDQHNSQTTMAGVMGGMVRKIVEGAGGQVFFAGPEDGMPDPEPDDHD